MLLELEDVFLQEGASRSFRSSMDLSSVDVNGVYPFVSPVEIAGSVENHAGLVQLHAQAAFRFSIRATGVQHRWSGGMSILFRMCWCCPWKKKRTAANTFR